MGQLVLQGALTAGPPSAGDAFPGSVSTIPLALSSTPKSAGPMTGVLFRSVASPSSFVTLTGVGVADTVTKGDTLYLRCDATVTLRMTRDDGLGGSVLELAVVSGLFIREFDPTLFLKLLEVQGTATIEYFVSGQQ